MEINRRELLKGTLSVAAIALLPGTPEASERRFKYFSSELTPQTLERQKKRAIDSLAKSIPSSDDADHLRAYIPYLSSESQMYIPDPNELRSVLEKSSVQLDELATALPEGSFGLFAFADIDDSTGMRRQRTYVVRKNAQNSVQFVKAYKISIAEKGFGNEPDSGQTPLGLHRIQSKTIGNFGEVVSARKKYVQDDKHFTHIPQNGKDRWYVNSFGRESGNEIAEVVTDEYLLVGPNTPASRAIRAHATNRSGELKADQSWNSLLDGKSLSGACLRFSNVDLRDAGLSGYIDSGTFVMIHATPAALAEAKERKNKAPAIWTPDK